MSSVTSLDSLLDAAVHQCFEDDGLVYAGLTFITKRAKLEYLALRGKEPVLYYLCADEVTDVLIDREGLNLLRLKMSFLDQATHTVLEVMLSAAFELSTTYMSLRDVEQFLARRLASTAR